MSLETKESLAGLSRSILNEFFHYHAASGCLYHKERARKHFKSNRYWKYWNTRFSGKLVGVTDAYGYRIVSIFGEHYGVHRIIWIMHHGGKIPQTIDHINGVRDDNRLANLRLATHAEQNRNAALGANNSSGCIGVSWAKARKKWVASITVNGIYNYLGGYVIKTEAIEARLAANKKFGFSANHGRESNNYARSKFRRIEYVWEVLCH